MTQPPEPPRDEQQEQGASPQGEPAPGLTWRDLHLWQIQPIRDILLVLAVFALVDLGYRISIVTVPLLLAIFLAYLFEPLVRRMTRLKVMGLQISRRISAACLIVTATVAIVTPAIVAGGFAVTQGLTYANELVRDIDAVIESSGADKKQRASEIEYSELVRVQREERERLEVAYEEALERGESPEPLPPASDPDEALRAELELQRESVQDKYKALPNNAWRQVHNWLVDVRAETESDTANAVNITLNWLRNNAESIASRAADAGKGAVDAAWSTLLAVGKFGFMAFLTAFFFFFISSSWGKVIEFAQGLLPERNRERIVELVVMMDNVVSGFVRGRIIISVIMIVYFSFMYWLIGVPAPLLLGPLVGLLSIAPYISLLALPITMGAMLLQPPVDPLFFSWQSQLWWALAGPFIVYQIGQIIDDYMLTPAIQGKSVNMDMPSILFATIAGGALAGIYGVLIAIPVAACMKILLREVFWPNFRAWARGERTDFLPIGRE